MKPAIKKLKTCTYSKDIAPLAATFGRREQHTNKLVCDHPEMKVDWNEKVCGPCTVYENRNAQLVVPVVPQPQAEAQVSPKGGSPAESKQSPSAVRATAVPVPTQPKPASKPVVTKPAAVPPPTLSAAKAPEKKTKAPAETKPKSSAKPTPKASSEQPQKPAKKTVAKPKK